ncbi:MAG TPA: hypothetical protein VHA77_11795 [Xanthobacteraceae bacterium]|jgi:hypothetical protein|nr:hypothetical protein [Xanthobacteraceae bacterium]
MIRTAIPHKAFVLAAVLASLLTACSLYDALAPGPEPEGFFIDHAYRQLVDKCMFEFRVRAPEACHCYADNVARQMSKSDLNSYSVTGVLPISVRADRSLAVCRRP